MMIRVWVKAGQIRRHVGVASGASEHTVRRRHPGSRVRRWQDVVCPVAVGALRSFRIAQVGQFAMHADAIPRLQVRVAIAATVRTLIAKGR